jgi:hypothetical protein
MRSPTVAWFLAAISAVLLAFVAYQWVADDPGRIGYTLGYFGAAFLVALGVRWIYWRTRASETRPPFWSPWILPLMAVIFIIARIGNASD